MTPQVQQELHVRISTMLRNTQANATRASTPRRSPPGIMRGGRPGDPSSYGREPVRSPGEPIFSLPVRRTALGEIAHYSGRAPSSHAGIQSAARAASRLFRAHLNARTPPALRRATVVRNVLLPSPPLIQAAPVVTIQGSPDLQRRSQPSPGCSQQPEPTHVSQATPPPGFGFIPESPSERPPNRFQDKWIGKLSSCTTFADFEGVVRDLTKQLQPPPKPRRAGAPSRGREGQAQRSPAEEAKRIQLLYKKNRKKAMREIRQENSPICDLPPEEVANHFEAVFKETLTSLEPPPACAVLPPTLQQDRGLVSPISRDTIKARLARCSDTAPGSDAISYSTLKSKDPGGHILHSVFNSCLAFN
ncbi:Sodium channel protein type 11 subunit alpha [Frankliniella fusca]|uniref:Sodium channel protein type 11 subunit alpha n=1 Tax=Frankliniella fusca TaxID=407009 RepID=A0AAE1HSK0_9NEOP|nr:Sodium channel protein type 11 subunit alpha [Frankliniella fusca]